MSITQIAWEVEESGWCLICECDGEGGVIYAKLLFVNDEKSGWNWYE